MISTLQELIAPMTEGAFADILRARKLEFRPAEALNRFGSLLTEDLLLDLIGNGAVPEAVVRITLKEQVIKPLLYFDGGKPSRAKISSFLDRGASVVVEPIQAFVPALRELCADIRRRIPEKVSSGAILTSGPGGALKLHYDPEDLIILQLAGSKRWMIFDHAVPNPVRGMPELAGPPGPPAFDRILNAGDLLFLPAGRRHRCENGTGRSLHLGILIRPPTAWHAVSALAKRLLAEEAFRIPLTRHASPAEAAAHQARVKGILADEIAKMALNDSVSEDVPEEFTKYD
jgi:ribosomal protein L16 Arg81 hydroxylase